MWGERKCNSVILYPVQIFSKKQRQQTKYFNKWKMSANTEPVSSYLRTNPELSTEDAKTKVGTKQWITQNMQLIPEGTGVAMTDGWASRSQLLKASIRSYINQQMEQSQEFGEWVIERRINVPKFCFKEGSNQHGIKLAHEFRKHLWILSASRNWFFQNCLSRNALSHT